VTARLLLVLLLVGCQAEPNAVDLTVVAASSLDDGLLAEVVGLKISVAGVYMTSKTYDVAGLPRQERVQLVPSVAAGSLDISVQALDANMRVLGVGTVSGVSITGKSVFATVTLVPPEAPKIALLPTSAKITRGKRLAFSADQTVVWSVLEQGGGSIDTQGVYTAPDLPGSYTIKATLTNDASVSATANISVVDYGVELVAGALGGSGHVDGVAGEARFADLWALASDGAGNLYLGENRGCTIRKMVAATSTVTTIAGKAYLCDNLDGTGDAAHVAGARSMAVDNANGALYVKAAGGGNLRKIDLATGVVTTIAVVPALDSQSLGMAFDPATNALYLSQPARHTIMRVKLGTTPAVSELVAGINGSPGSNDSPNASFKAPSGVLLDSGYLYVADTGNHTIRRITLSDGTVSTLAGSVSASGTADGVGVAASFRAPSSLALNNGVLYIGDGDSGTIRTLTLVNNSVSTLAGQPHIVPPLGMPQPPVLSLDANKGLQARFGTGLPGLAIVGTKLYVVDHYNAVVRTMDLGQQNTVTTVAGTPPSYGSADGVGSAARFYQLGSLTGDGKVFYQADNANLTVRKLDLATGTVTTLAGSATIAGGDDGVKATFERPEGIALIGRTVYLGDGNAGTIRGIDVDTGITTTIAGSHLANSSTDGTGAGARFTYPIYLVGDGQKYLYVSDANAIRRVTLPGGKVETLFGDANQNGFVDDAGTAARFAGPLGLALDNGALYISDNNRVRRADLTTLQVTTVAGNGVAAVVDDVGTNASFGVNGVMVGDGNGTLYVADIGAVRRVVLSTGAVTTMVGVPFQLVERPGPLPASIGLVGGLAITAGGDLLFGDAFESAMLLLRAP